MSGCFIDLPGEDLSKRKCLHSGPSLDQLMAELDRELVRAFAERKLSIISYDISGPFRVFDRTTTRQAEETYVRKVIDEVSSTTRHARPGELPPRVELTRRYKA